MPRPACRSIRSRSTRRSSCGRSTRSRRPNSPARRATEENFERLREILHELGGAARRGRGPRQGGPRLPSGDRARHQEQRLPQDLQRLLRDGRAAPADLFQRSRARPQVACRASADLRRAAAARRQSRAGADERASAGRGELLEGPDQGGAEEAGRRWSRSGSIPSDRASSRMGRFRTGSWPNEKDRARHLLDASAASARDRDARGPATSSSPRRSTRRRWPTKARDADIVIVRAPLPPALFERATEAARGDPPRRRARHDPGRGSDQGRRAGRQRARRQCALGRRARVLSSMALLRRFRQVDRDLRQKGWLAGRDHADQAASSPAARWASSASALSARQVAEIAARLRARRDRQQPQRRRDLPDDVRFASVDELVEASDIVVLCCPLTPETTGLISRDRIARMKPGALLVNVSRGPVVDDAALIEALSAGRIGGAALDVFVDAAAAARSSLFLLRQCDRHAAYGRHHRGEHDAHGRRRGRGGDARASESCRSICAIPRWWSTIAGGFRDNLPSLQVPQSVTTAISAPRGSRSTTAASAGRG